MNYPQIIREVKKKGYFEAVTCAEIFAERERLLKIPEKDLLGSNLQEAKIIRALVEVKLAVTGLLERGIKKEDEETVLRLVDLCKASYREAKLAQDKDFVGAEETFGAISAAITRIVSQAEEIRADFNRLIKEGAFVGTLSDFTELKQKYGALRVEEIRGLFPETKGDVFRFASVKERVEAVIAKKVEELSQAMFAGYSLSGVTADTVSQYDALQTIPGLSVAQGAKDAPVLFVCTPIREEFDILLSANAEHGVKNILQIELAQLSKKSFLSKRDATARFLLFAIREKKPGAVAFYGLDALSEEQKKTLFAAVSDALNFIPMEMRFIFWDPTGDMAGLTGYNLCREALGLVHAENRYLRLPAMADLSDVTQSLTQAQLEKVRVQCVFMGYRGINLFYAASSELSLALESAKSISDKNAPAVLAFLQKLPDDSKLVPPDWGYRPEVKKTTVSSDEYDYDAIRDVSDERIRRIIANGSLNIYEKCGELVRYILLADEDKSVWMGVLDEEERLRRITLATQIVAYTMKLYYAKPAVEVVEARNEAWGGLCCDGGALIKYKRTCTEDISWMMDAILHELYHSLQHTLTDTGVDPTWYKKQFHVSNERIASWNDNNGVYQMIGDANEKIYMVQTLEVDARDFAGLCLGDQVYHNHDRIVKKV